jgi:hypothetical protein
VSAAAITPSGAGHRGNVPRSPRRVPGSTPGLGTMYDHRFRHDKRPRARALRLREHFTKKNGTWKPKMVFENIANANNYIQSRAFFRENVYVSYICGYCGGIHIGKLNDKQK